MKLFQYTEDMLAHEVEIPLAGVHFLIKTESGTFRVRADEDGVLVSETTFRTLGVFPEAGNVLKIKGVF